MFSCLEKLASFYLMFLTMLLGLVVTLYFLKLININQLGPLKPNSARKFLEAFLYFKYPNANEKDHSKLVKFFDGYVRSKILIERVTNEYLHLAGVFERSMTPVEIPEMKTSAQFILNKINEKDPKQYSALLESIDNPEINF